MLQSIWLISNFFLQKGPMKSQMIDKIHVTRIYTFHPMKRVSLGTNKGELVKKERPF